jgi:ketosteroid isomerase-like protein
VKDELIDLSHALARAIAERDGDTLDGILHEDFVHLASGEQPSPPRDKTAFMEAIRGAGYDIVAMEVNSLRVKLAEDVAVVVGIQDARVELAGAEQVSSTSSFTDVFRRVDGRWRLWLAHSTELGAC